MNKQIKHLLVGLVLLLTFNVLPLTASAQGTAFAYSGRLNVNGSPANGNYDLQFTLYNAITNGTEYGSVTNTATSVINGLFTVALDFGPVFNGSNYWLQIAVRTNGNGTFIALIPLQPISPTPYAIYSETAENAATATTAASASTAGIAGSANSVSSANIVGTLQLTQLPVSVVKNNQSGVSLSGTFNGNGMGLTNLNLTGASSISILGNEADGYGALATNTVGFNNTANGVQSLKNNTYGNNNTANGYFALYFNIGGFDNTASGAYGLFLNDIGYYNTANGYFALYSNTNGIGNTASGDLALFNNASGNYNIAEGYQAGYNITSGNFNIDIGNMGLATDANVIRIGVQGVQTNTTIAGIFGATTASGVPVYVTSTGQLGTLTSSARFKQDVQSMNNASEVLLSLHPVTFRYKPEIDPQGIPQFGLVAEEVEKVDPDLVARDDKGEPYTVRYEAVNAMLLNEFLKEHRQIAEQNTEIETLKQSVAELKQIVQSLTERK